MGDAQSRIHHLQKRLFFDEYSKAFDEIVTLVELSDRNGTESNHI
jgi:hypothetical protein